MTEAPAKRVMVGMILGIIVLAAVNLKVRLSAFTPRYNPDDETAYFRTESAYQYRYARMIAAGQAMPELDHDGQYPEGVRPTRELTPFMEYATGWTYRVLRKLHAAGDFRWFVVLWVAMVSSLTIPVFFLLSRRLCGATAPALAATAVYGLSWASLSNMVGTYVFESFAEPLMLGGLACLCATLDGEEKWRTAAAWSSGLLIAAGLASWHLARFYWMSVVLALIWTAWRRRHDAAALARLRAALIPLLAVSFAAGLGVGCLRESAFATSPAMIIGLGLLLWLWLPERRPAALAATAAALLVVALRSRDASVYGHVYGYLAARLRYGLMRPPDPSVLSDEARAIWNGPADSPTIGFLIFCLLPLGLVALPRAVAAAKREQAEPTLSGPLIDALLVMYAAGTALALRLMELLAFFLCLASMRLPVNRARAPFLIAGLALLALFEGFKTWKPASRWNPVIRLSAAFPDDDRRPATTFLSELEVIRWLKTNAGPSAPVLADVAFSANFLTYAGTPVLIHPKYEAPGIRAKVAEYLRALYSGEDSFYAYCRKYGAKYFVLTVYDVLDETADGPRYTSGSMRLKSDAAAVLMQFQPRRLKHFRLVFQNDDFRIFAVGQAPDAKTPTINPPIYDMNQFAPRVLPDGSLSLDVVGVLKRISESRQKLYLARVFLRGRMPEAALDFYEAAFKAWPADAAARREYEGLRKALEQSR